MKFSILSTSLTVACTALTWSSVQANYFSRLVNPKITTDEDRRPAPSGATVQMGSEAAVGSVISVRDGAPFATLANHNRIPLVGYGVGNLKHELIPGMVSAALQDSRKIRLIDTAHASGNEELVAKGIIKGVEKLEHDDKAEVHVVTKVWYTHLGYERTKQSVMESLEALKPAFEHDKVDLKLHMMLHWPRCFENIPWMDCAGEERNLPDFVKALGPNPNEDSNAWKESWRALEDMYLSGDYPITSIGVSNFHLHDLESMASFARIHPHVLQVNVWSLLSDSHLVDYCHKNKIHVQVYNVMHGTVSHPENAPKAFHHIQKIAYEVSKTTGTQVTPAQVILAWLIQHGVSVIPRTSSPERLSENSAVALMNVPAFSDFQVETLAHAVEAYLSGKDLEQDIHVSVTFYADSDNLMLYWMGHDGDETRIAYVPKGESFDELTYPNHVYRTYLALNKDVWIEHEVDANFGEHQDIHVTF